MLSFQDNRSWKNDRWRIIISKSNQILMSEREFDWLGIWPNRNLIGCEFDWMIQPQLQYIVTWPNLTQITIHCIWPNGKLTELEFGRMDHFNGIGIPTFGSFLTEQTNTLVNTNKKLIVILFLSPQSIQYKNSDIKNCIPVTILLKISIKLIYIRLLLYGIGGINRM